MGKTKATRAKDDGGTAFPFQSDLICATGKNQGKALATPGMSLRDYFAAEAMNGICSNADESLPTIPSSRHDLIAKSAYSIADAMLKARGESP